MSDIGLPRPDRSAPHLTISLTNASSSRHIFQLDLPQGSVNYSLDPSRSQEPAMFKIIGSDGKEYGPVSADVLRQWIAERRAGAQTHVQAEGSVGWKTLSEFPEFAAALTANPQVAP